MDGFETNNVINARDVSGTSFKEIANEKKI
jgi:hypothetical protein